MHARKMLLVVALAACAAIFATPVAAHAMVLRQGQTVTVRPDETINDDLYAFGSNVSIEGTVNGDVIAAGQSVSITGHVSGGVFAAGQTVIVSGPIAGSVRAAGQSVQVSGKTDGDALLAGSSVSLLSQGAVGRDLAIGASDITVLGAVGRNLDVAGSTVSLGGTVGGNARVQGSSIKVLPTGRIEGALDYYSNAKPQVAGTVAGTITGHAPPKANSGRAAAAGSAGALGVFWLIVAWVQGLVGMVLFGLVLLLAIPTSMKKSVDAVVIRPWPSLGFGCLTVAVVPAIAFVIFLLGLLVGGWWIAFILLMLYGVALIVASIVGALAFGTVTIGRARRPAHPIWLMIFGLAAIWIVGLVPLVGWLAGFVATLFGLGGLVITSWAGMRAQRTSAPPAPATPVPELAPAPQRSPEAAPPQP